MIWEPDRWPNFSDTETSCKCGCGLSLEPVFLDILQAMRKEYGAPLKVTSGARCPAYNAQVSETGLNGPHTLGLAADIAIASNLERYVLLGLALKRGIHRIGLARSFMHFDISPNHPPNRIWLYS